MNISRLKYQIPSYLIAVSVIFLFCSCAIYELTVKKVCYQSVTISRDTSPGIVPVDAKIVVGYNFDADGRMTVFVTNNTDSIMYIYLKNSKVEYLDKVQSYYNPLYKANSPQQSYSLIADNIPECMTSSKGEKSIYSKIRVMDLSSDSIAALPAKATGAISQININIIGKSYLKTETAEFNDRRSTIVSKLQYRLLGDAQRSIIETTLSVEPSIVSRVANGDVNDALRYIYRKKPDCLQEPFFMLYFDNNVANSLDSFVKGLLLDYK